MRLKKDCGILSYDWCMQYNRNQIARLFISSQYWRRQTSHIEILPSHPLTIISHSISCSKLMLKGTGKVRLASGSGSTWPINLILLQAPSRKQPGASRPACYPTIQTGKHKKRRLFVTDRKTDLVEVLFKFSISRYCNYYAIFPDRLWETEAC